MVYHGTVMRESLALQRSPTYAATIHPCSTDTLGRYPFTLPRACLAQRVVSPLSRNDHHDGVYRGSTRQEFGLAGTYVTCRGRVARVLEGAPVSEALQPGDRVIWWKRIPGGDYVYPVQATVLALTAKRVKIEADDDGAIVIRHVPPESLERHA
jgi:hypothetical protein